MELIKMLVGLIKMLVGIINNNKYYKNKSIY